MNCDGLLLHASESSQQLFGKLEDVSDMSHSQDCTSTIHKRPYIKVKDKKNLRVMKFIGKPNQGSVISTREKLLNSDLRESDVIYCTLGLVITLWCCLTPCFGSGRLGVSRN